MRKQESINEIMSEIESLKKSSANEIEFLEKELDGLSLEIKHSIDILTYEPINIPLKNDIRKIQ